MSEFCLVEVVELFFVKFEGFEFKFVFILGVFFLFLMLFGEGEVWWLVLDCVGEVFFIEGDDVFFMLLCVGELFFVEGDIFWINGFVVFVEVEGGDDLEFVING